MIDLKDIEQAYLNIKDDILKTPLVFSPRLSELSGAKVYLKMEQLQKTGSFKIRGVLNKLGHFSTNDYKKTFVAASTGNHAAAFCYASEKFEFKGVLFLPENVSEVKLKALEKYVVDKRFYGKSSMETEERATSYANEINGFLIHPYNDLQIIAGQGTIAKEIHDELPEVSKIFVPIGGGGLISGICTYSQNFKKIAVIGCQPKNACEMYDSIQKGYIVEPSKLPTVADASAGGIEANSVTFYICKNHVSAFEIIDEIAIKKAVAFMVKHHETEIEPTAAIPVAALMNSKKYKNETVVLVLTGKKINKELLSEILSTYG